MSHKKGPLFGSGSHYVAQVGLELSNLLPQPPECWDYRHAPGRKVLLYCRVQSHTQDTLSSKEC
jgi:hypothetical protein